MDDLIDFQPDKPFPVDGRDLHRRLGVGRDFSNWVKGRIERFQFVEFVDYQLLSRSPNPASGNRGASTDYSLTVQAAKMIAAVENTEAGRSVLAHLVKVESAWNTPEMILVRAQQASQIIIDRMKAQIAEIAPDAAAARVIACSTGLKTISEVGKINGIGPRRLIDLMLELGIVFRNRGSLVPYQRYIDAGYFVVREKAVGNGDEKFLRSQTYMTGKGEVWLAKQLFIEEHK